MYLANFDFGTLRERFEDEHPEYAHRFDEVAEELKKFLAMPHASAGPLAAMSHAVDGLWHVFINHTPQYAEFCEDSYGQFLHHQPRSASYLVPTEAISNFYRDYPKLYGAVPAIWFEDIPQAHVVAVAQGQVPDDVRQLRWSGWPGWQPHTRTEPQRV
jgi:hypothetical protein